MKEVRKLDVTEKLDQLIRKEISRQEISEWAALLLYGGEQFKLVPASDSDEIEKILEFLSEVDDKSGENYRFSEKDIRYFKEKHKRFWKKTLCLDDIVYMLNDLIDGRITRERANKRAGDLISYFERNMLIIPAEEEEKVWKGLVFLFGVDLLDNSGGYLHPISDITLFKQNLINNSF